MFFDGNEKNWSIPCVYPKDYVIVSEGDYCNEIGMILEGKISMVHYSESGESSILATLHKGDIFGDLLIFASQSTFIGHLITHDKTRIVYMSKENVADMIDTDAIFRNRFMKNISDKALTFNMKHKLLQQPSLKDRILFYLESEMLKQNKQKIEVPPFQYWAEILNVQRPSLSRMITHLLEQGVISRSKRVFWFTN